MVSCVFSRLLYAAETWMLKAKDTRRLLTFETRCYRKLKISWRDRITNTTVRERIGTLADVSR